MRVNPNQWMMLLETLNRATAAENDALRAVATGRKLNVPSDDPAAMALLMENQAEQGTCDQYVSSLSTLQGSLQSADSALSGVVTALTRAIALGVEGANGTLSSANRKAIAGEVTGIRDQILTLANTSFNGSYLFAGAVTSTAPFIVDSSSPSGVRYNGDDTVCHVPTGDGTSIEINTPGDQLFNDPTADVFDALQTLVLALQSGSGIDTATENLRGAFDHLSAKRVTYGSALSRLESETTLQSSAKLQLQTAENALAGIDPAEAISRLTNAENARNATLAAAAQIHRTSLLDYLH